jgi:hypothetical protein
MTSLHDKITNNFLPEFAKQLQIEGVISYSDRKPFEFSAMDDLPHFEIRPDRVLYLLHGEKILVEIVNPRDPKRLMGEITYPQILIQKELISAAFFFIIGSGKQAKNQHRSLIEKWMLSDIIESKKPCWMMSWSSYETSYLNLKAFLTNPMFFPKKGNVITH